MTMRATKSEKTVRIDEERGRLLARIHCLKKELAWSDDEYRDILQGMTGARSAAGLTLTALRMVAEDFAAMSRGKRRQAPAPAGASNPVQDEWGFVWRAAQEKRPLLRKIFAVCRDLGVGRTYAEGVAKKQCGGVARKLEMMSYDELYKVAQALANTQRAGKAKAVRAADGDQVSQVSQGSPVGQAGAVGEEVAP
jgi:hypothetical protein